MPKRIKVVVDEEGKVSFLYEGFKGTRCFDEAQDILFRLKKLGIDVAVEKVEKTHEAYETEKTSEVVKNHV